MAKTNKVYYQKSEGEFIAYYAYELGKETQDKLEHIRELRKPFYFTPSVSEPHFTIDSVHKNFRLYPQHSHYGVYSSSEESATHKYCIQEICDLNSLQIKLKNSIPNYPKGSIVKFDFNYAFPEFEISMGDSTIVRPDILLFLRAPADLAIYFKRVLVVEIVVTHNIDEKIKIYDKARVPVLRIKANPKWGKKYESEMSETEKNDLKKWIRNSFRDTYSADLLLPEDHKIILENKVIEKAKNDVLEAKNETEHLRQELGNVLTENKKLIDAKNEINLIISKNNKINSSLKSELSSIELEKKELINDLKKKTQKISIRNKAVIALIVYIIGNYLLF